jgi:hypothetical protein
MKSGEDIESYLLQLEANYSVVSEHIWLIRDGGFDLVVSISEPLVVLRVKLLDLSAVPSAKRERFFQTLLELNAGQMVHGSYGLEEGSVVVTEALQLENLDFNEFQAAVDDITLSVSNHYPILKSLTA